MAKISVTDVIFITIVQNGITKFSQRITGITSLPSIMSTIKNVMPDMRGLATFQVRNSTAGWNHSQTLLLR